jgi:hypothetical protein
MQGLSDIVYKPGTLIIVRAFGDRPLCRAILSYTKDAVFVCREESYPAIASGEREMPLIGFPIRDAFEAPEWALTAIRAGKPVDLAKLRPLGHGPN